MLREVGIGMCEVSGKSDGEHGRLSRVSICVGNIRDSRSPWHRTVIIAAANFLRRVRPLRSCCGNVGHPGC